MEEGDWDRVRKRDMGRCWGSVVTIPDHLSTFIRFVQLKSLRKRTDPGLFRLSEA